MNRSWRRHPLLKPVRFIYNWFRFRCQAHFGSMWRERLADALGAPDNAFIPRVPNAGELLNGCQVMHNGLRIHRGSYYGYAVTRMLKLNRGVHEPQEERAFAEVLEKIPPGATMLELGAYWAFYSMWFNQRVPNARNFMVEPDPDNLKLGVKNFELNGMKGDFTHAFVGGTMSEVDGVRQICVDGFMAEKGIEHLDMLHSDIQGFELEMIKGADRALREKRVDYVFISTHSNELHEDCLNALEAHGYLILAECDLRGTYSYDGVIVARSPVIQGPTEIEISKKPAAG